MIEPLNEEILNTIHFYDSNLKKYHYTISNKHRRTLDIIQSKFINKQYIDIGENYLYIHFVISNLFGKLNLEIKDNIYNYIDILNFIKNNYEDNEIIKIIEKVIADCFLFLGDKNSWFNIINSHKSIFPFGGPIEAGLYLNYHSFMNIEIEPFDLMSFFKYKINKKLLEYDLSLFKKEILNSLENKQYNIFEDYEFEKQYESYYDKKQLEYREKNFHHLNIFSPFKFIFHNYNYQNINLNNFSIPTDHFMYFFGSNPYDHDHWDRTHFKYKTFLRDCENSFRKKIGLKNVGESWVSETTLYHQLKNNFSNDIIVQHGKPKFLGKQHYDIWFPDLNIAIEYHGKQHFEPIDFFGGEEAYQKTILRDQLKIDLSEKNGVNLIVVSENYQIHDIIDNITKIKNSKV